MPRCALSSTGALIDPRWTAQEHVPPSSLPKHAPNLLPEVEYVDPEGAVVAYGHRAASSEPLLIVSAQTVLLPRMLQTEADALRSELLALAGVLLAAGAGGAPGESLFSLERLWGSAEPGSYRLRGPRVGLLGFLARAFGDDAKGMLLGRLRPDPLCVPCRLNRSRIPFLEQSRRRSQADRDWHLRRCGIREGAGAAAGELRVALVDSGAEGNTLSGNVEPPLAIGNRVQGDTHGHGTEIASILDRLLEHAGAEGVSILPIAVLDRTARAFESDLVLALTRADELGCRVINCSWFVQDEAKDLKNRIADLKNAIVVTAIDNSRTDLDDCPQAQWLATDPPANLVVVGATDETDRWPLAYGRQRVHVGAPGIDVYCRERRRYLDGSSISSVLTAGVLALAIAQTGAERDQVLEALLATVSKTPPSRRRCRSEGVVSFDALVARLTAEIESGAGSRKVVRSA